VVTSPGSLSGKGPLELLMLSALPCGCVVAGYRVSSLDVELVALEAKGSHCTVIDHHSGHVLGFGKSPEDVVAGPLCIETP